MGKGGGRENEKLIEVKKLAMRKLIKLNSMSESRIERNKYVNKLRTEELMIKERF